MSAAAAPMLLAWLHDLSPFVVRLSGDFGIRWYGLAYMGGFVIAFVLLRWLGRRGAALIPPYRAADAIMILVIGVMLGGRLGYILFYDPGLLVHVTSSPPWWGALMVNRGGMASHGGMIGVILAAWYVARGLRRPDGSPGKRIPVLHVLDMTALLAPPGLMLGRIANFINGELLGKIVAMPGEPAPWWAVKFPQEFPYDHDCSKYMAPEEAHQRLRAIEGIVRGAGYDGDLAAGYRAVVEKIQSGNSALAQQLEPWISARHPSQLYQAAAEGLVVGGIVWWIARRPRRPGVIGCWFLISYGVLRVLTELYRLPDANLQVQRIAGLSRGQWLSVAMVAVGAILLAIVSRRNVDRIGGWGTPRTVDRGIDRVTA
ncbi:MAG: Prolipoprotein diacylglyceryl transferase [Phycisphaerales bacterium]|nr:Prolipoprotein diacylglyceryl transferase [Phycisphaerales bacterium]